MKEEKEASWDSLESQWRDQLDKHEAPFPAFDWEKLDVGSKPTIPLWRQLTESPWVWAAVLGIAIGINWQPVETVQNSLPVLAVQEKNTIKSTTPEIALYAEQPAPAKRPGVELVNQPNVLTPSPIEVVDVVKSTEMPKELEKTEEDVIYVRVDIDPMEENRIQPVEEVLEKPMKRKRNLIGQILRQVVAGEPGGWREIANSNEKLAEGIHQVANTVIRTEQSVKQTLQLQ